MFIAYVAPFFRIWRINYASANNASAIMACFATRKSFVAVCFQQENQEYLCKI
jgi:hypothetical protein